MSKKDEKYIDGLLEAENYSHVFQDDKINFTAKAMYTDFRMDLLKNTISECNKAAKRTIFNNNYLKLKQNTFNTFN